jgi:hypothetical protein
MSRFTHKIMRSLIGVVAVVALALAALGGAGPAAHADDGVYPPSVYGPGGTCCVALGGYWAYGGGVGLTGQELYTWSNGPDAESSFAVWDAGGLDPGTIYDVCAYIPNDNANARAEYTLTGFYGDSGPSVVDQSKYSNQWAYVGGTVPTRTGHISVHLSDMSLDPYLSTVIGADAMMFIPSQNDTLGQASPGDFFHTTCLPNG